MITSFRWYTTCTVTLLILLGYFMLDGTTSSVLALTTTDCRGCHTGEPYDSVAQQHHATLRSCGSCHATVVGAPEDFDCFTCHYPDSLIWNAVDVDLAHSPLHDRTGLSAADCSTCHVDNVYTEHGARSSLLDNEGHLNCALCHQSTRQEVVDAIALGSGPDGETITCDRCHATMSTIGHTDDHDRTFTNSPDCHLCHQDNVVIGHVVNRGLTCGACHDSPDQQVLNSIENGRLGNEIFCSDCHGSGSGSQAHIASHDRTFVNEQDCLQCHVDNVVTEHVVNRSLECATCHASPDPLVQNAIAAGMAGTNVFCSDCHGPEAGMHDSQHDRTFVNEQDCLQCHVDNVVTEHVVNRSLECTTCHASPDPLVQNAIAAGMAGTNVFCSDCHGQGAGLHDSQHDRTFVNEQDCLQCHVDNVVTEHVVNRSLECATCHASPDPLVQNAIAAGMAGTNVFCSDCHGPEAGMHEEAHDRTFTDSPDCRECHADNVVIEHVTNRTLVCADCHDNPDQLIQDAISRGMDGEKVYCSDCHGQVLHLEAHDMTVFTEDPADETLCASCHINVLTSIVTEHLARGYTCATCHDSTDLAVQDAIASGRGANGRAVLCTDCHYQAEEPYDIHVAAHDTVCATCHKLPEQEDGSILGIHDRTERDVIRCVDCHRWGSTDVERNTIFSNSVNADPGEPPDYDYDPTPYLNGVCLRCHKKQKTNMGGNDNKGCLPCHFDSPDESWPNEWYIDKSSGSETWGHNFRKRNNEDKTVSKK
ncbi:MAG: hypothetical protein Kow0089_13750 [Desulfobulbaceae bacterium]